MIQNTYYDDLRNCHANSHIYIADCITFFLNLQHSFSNKYKYKAKQNEFFSNLLTTVSLYAIMQRNILPKDDLISAQ